MTRLRYLLLLSLLVNPLILADEPITKPIRYTWIATSCANWNCAAAALVLANGSKDVIVLPTGQEDIPWILLRRVEEGAIVIPETEAYACESFVSEGSALLEFQSLDKCHGGLLLTVPDGKTVVVSRSACVDGTKRRAVSR